MAVWEVWGRGNGGGFTYGEWMELIARYLTGAEGKRWWVERSGLRRFKIHTLDFWHFF